LGEKKQDCQHLSLGIILPHLPAYATLAFKKGQ